MLSIEINNNFGPKKIKQIGIAAKIQGVPD